MATRTRFWLGLLALASLTHCAGNPTALTHDAALAPGEGVVLLRVVGNASEPWSQLELAPDTGGTPQTVFAADFAENSSGVFVGKLPAGRYRPVQMKAALQTGNLVTTLEVPLEARLGRFAVEAGRVTNLGTVVYQEYGAMVKMHIKNAVVRSPAPAPSAALLHSQFPAVAAAVEGKPELGWDDPVRAPSPQLVQVLRDGRGQVRGLNGASLAQGGAVWAGARLGALLVRESVRAPWRRIDTGALHEIMAVAPLPQDRILAGGEEGLVVLSQDRGRSWTRLSVVAPERIVVFVGGTASGAVVLVAQGADDLQVWMASDPRSAWRQIGQIATARDRREGVVPGTPSGDDVVRWRTLQHPDFVALTDARLVIYSDERKLSTFDFASQRWDSVETPFVAHHTLAMPDGHLFAMPPVGASMFGSSDWGHSWQKLDYFTFASAPAFASDTTGYLAARPYGTTEIWRMMKTTDGAKTWNEQSELAFMPRKVIVDPASHALLALSVQGETFLSGDDGKSWQAAN